MKQLALISLLIVSIMACNLKDKMKENIQDSFKMIADNNFKHAIAIIELYKIRHGEYPGSLFEIDYMSTLDMQLYTSVKYEKLDSGYRLDISKTAITGGSTALSYPEGFWQGLGLRKSNVLKTGEPVKAKAN